MWSNYIQNNGDIKKYYGDRDPDLSDAHLCSGIEIHNPGNEVVFYFEFFDWPTPLPKDWIVDTLACITLDLRLENVHFNSVNANGSYVHCSVSIEADEKSIRLSISDKENGCILDLSAQKATVRNFGYYNHKYD